MRKEISIEDAIGKKIEKYICEYDQLVILTEDNTFFAVQIERGNERGDEIIDLIGHFDWLNMSKNKLVRYGMLSEDEYDQMYENERKEFEKRKEANEWKEYKRLKYKFEGEEIE